MEGSGKTCPQVPTFPWEAHPSDLWSSQSGFGMPPVLTKSPLVRVTLQRVLAKGTWVTQLGELAEELRGWAGL